VCRTLGNSAEIRVAIRNLAKTGNLGRVVYSDFACCCVLDACCPFNTPSHRAPISHVDHVCVRVWLSICLRMPIATTYADEHCNWCRVVRL